MAPRASFVDSIVERRCPAGHALVLRCRPVRNDRDPVEPFPTLFWLACDAVAAQIARLEYEGGVATLEARLVAEPALHARVDADHDAYVRERWALLSADERASLEATGRAAALRERGIGGIADRATVKCLHLHYAHHLARGSALGEAIDALGEIRLCDAPSGAPPSG